MSSSRIDKSRLYDSGNHFFELAGSVTMKLTPRAAIDVCMYSAQHGLVVARIEGGIWHSPRFEARLDCIWDGSEPPLAQSEAEVNNLKAAEFIRAMATAHDAFILTAPPISGWPHNRS